MIDSLRKFGLVIDKLRAAVLQVAPGLVSVMLHQVILMNAALLGCFSEMLIVQHVQD